MDEQKGLIIWNKVLTGAMSIPGVKIDRTSFLITSFANYCDKDTLQGIVEKCPSVYLSTDLIDSVAKGVINSQTAKVTAMSAAAGIPGGLAMLGTVPADIAQYYYHALVLAQKLAYLYGHPSLTDSNGFLSEDAKNQLTIFVGVMSGVSVANEALNALSRAISEQIAKRLPKMALTKTTIYPLIKNVAKWVGIKITRDSFSKNVSKVIPILGGVFSGALTYTTFKPSAKRFQNKLKENMPYITASFK